MLITTEQLLTKLEDVHLKKPARSTEPWAPFWKTLHFNSQYMKFKGSRRFFLTLQNESLEAASKLFTMLSTLVKDLHQLFRAQKYPSVTLDMEVADEWVHLHMVWHTLEARLKILEYQHLRASWSATTPEKKSELAAKYEEIMARTRAHYLR